MKVGTIRTIEIKVNVQEDTLKEVDLSNLFVSLYTASLLLSVYLLILNS